MDHNDDDLQAALRSLREDSSRKSETARLRAIFDDVEAALKSGARREDVLETLRAKGFTMNINGFKTMLQRIRRERRATAAQVDRKP